MDVDQASALRVPLVTPGTRPDLAPLELRIRAERGRISLLYQVLLNSAPIAAGWEQMLTAVRNRTDLAADLRELAILRVAVLNGASFEFDAHVPHAERAGVSPEKLVAIRQAGTIDPVFTPTERMVLALTDAMTRDVEVPDEVFEPLHEVLAELPKNSVGKLVKGLLRELDLPHCGHG